jgi:hypothetical protein
MERQLRLLLGLPINDGELLRPVDEPLLAKVEFDWHEVLLESLTRRPELRRQQWQIKRRELELLAARNFLKPRLDTVGRYRWRGLGHDLLDPNGNSPDPFDNAYGNLLDGKYQEWQLGLEYTTPFGFRQGHAAVRNAELQLARERAILMEQERDIAHGLSNAVAELERAYRVSQTNYNRRLAARQQLLALEAVYDDADQGEKTRLLDLLLDAQRRLADAESRYYRALVEYTLAVKQVHVQKGSLLDYSEVFLSEGPWPGQAAFDAARRECRTGPPCYALDYRLTPQAIISRGNAPPAIAQPVSEVAPAEPLAPPAQQPGPLDAPPGLPGPTRLPEQLP